MVDGSGNGIPNPRWGRALLAGFALALCMLTIPRTLPAQSPVPQDRFHFSVTLGGYFLLGIGYTHFVEEHHTLEFTVFPFAHPWEGFPFGVRAGYGWIPSNEVWRAKLGGNLTLLFRPGDQARERFTPILALTPGIQYDPDKDRSFRADLWMSYYLDQRLFAPTAVEFFYGWPR